MGKRSLQTGDPVIYRRTSSLPIPCPAFLAEGSVGTVVDRLPRTGNYIVKFEGVGAINCAADLIHLHVNLQDLEEVEAWLAR